MCLIEAIEHSQPQDVDLCRVFGFVACGKACTGGGGVAGQHMCDYIDVHWHVGQRVKRFLHHVQGWQKLCHAFARMSHVPKELPAEACVFGRSVSTEMVSPMCPFLFLCGGRQALLQGHVLASMDAVCHVDFEKVWKCAVENMCACASQVREACMRRGIRGCAWMHVVCEFSKSCFG